MSNPKNENTSVPNGSILEPFPEPNTMPEGWDMSSIFSDVKENLITEQIINMNSLGNEE